MRREAEQTHSPPEEACDALRRSEPSRKNYQIWLIQHRPNNSVQTHEFHTISDKFANIYVHVSSGATIKKTFVLFFF